MDDPGALIGVRWWRVVHRHSAKAIGLAQIEVAKLSSADAYGVLQNTAKHRLKISERARNDPQHLGDCRLLLQRLAKLATACLHLLEQPNIFDSDHGLIGKCGHQFDLFGRKWLRSGSRGSHDADASALSEEWDPQHRAETSEFLTFMPSIFRIIQN